MIIEAILLAASTGMSTTQIGWLQSSLTRITANLDQPLKGGCRVRVDLDASGNVTQMNLERCNAADRPAAGSAVIKASPYRAPEGALQEPWLIFTLKP